MKKKIRADERGLVSKDEIRKRLLKYTRKAFRMLPRLDKPRILDIGCGSGVSTLELARLSRGEVIGIDIDQAALDKFSGRIKEAGLAARVKAIQRSLLNMDFAAESFDIIWCEGAVYPVGFERGLREWKRFLKPGGFLVVHDEQGNIAEKLEQISRCGYELLGHFTLSEDVWWKDYFAPLENWIARSRARPADHPAVLEELRQAQREMEMFKAHPECNRSVCFVIRRN